MSKILNFTLVFLLSVVSIGCSEPEPKKNMLGQTEKSKPNMFGYDGKGKADNETIKYYDTVEYKQANKTLNHLDKERIRLNRSIHSRPSNSIDLPWNVKDSYYDKFGWNRAQIKAYIKNTNSAYGLNSKNIGAISNHFKGDFKIHSAENLQIRAQVEKVELEKLFDFWNNHQKPMNPDFWLAKCKEIGTAHTDTEILNYDSKPYPEEEYTYYECPLKKGQVILDF